MKRVGFWVVWGGFSDLQVGFRSFFITIAGITEQQLPSYLGW
jgi:hypothetical protein